jgi:hypothetical protein
VRRTLVIYERRLAHGRVAQEDLRDLEGGRWKVTAVKFRPHGCAEMPKLLERSIDVPPSGWLRQSRRAPHLTMTMCELVRRLHKVHRLPSLRFSLSHRPTRSDLRYFLRYVRPRGNSDLRWSVEIFGAILRQARREGYLPELCGDFAACDGFSWLFSGFEHAYDTWVFSLVDALIWGGISGGRCAEMVDRGVPLHLWAAMKTHRLLDGGWRSLGQFIARSKRAAARLIDEGALQPIDRGRPAISFRHRLRRIQGEWERSRRRAVLMRWAADH